MSLNQLIKDMGIPKILIDHWGDKNKGYACFNFNESLIWNDQGLFFNNTHIKNPTINDLQLAIDSWKNGSKDICAIGFINYNFKNILFPHIRFRNKNKDNIPYIYFVKPEKLFTYDIVKESFSNNIDLELIEDIMNVSEYGKIIDYIKNKLKNGDVYQINYTMQKKFSIKNKPIDIYLNLRQRSKPRFGYYFDLKDLSVLSFSPEQFFKVENNNIYSYPMKGTRPRSNNNSKDLIFKNELMKSAKDAAEHLMIVDLLRNDLGKICKYGSVNVKDLYNIKSFETIHHMESEIYGELLENMTFKDILNALFPSGSITGAPKERSMEIIDEVENYNRGIYTGSIGYLSSKGSMNFNVAIRTLFFNQHNGQYCVGGGIVWDSTVEGERLEALNKAKIINHMLDNQTKEHG